MLNQSHHDYSPLAVFMAENLLSRLDFLTLKPKRILEVSVESGYSSDLLQKKFGDAEIIIHDLKNSLQVEGEPVDLIFANLIFSFNNYWENSLPLLRKFLKKDGIMLFSCLGLDTLSGLVDRNLLSVKLFDMHNLGDELVKNKFVDPVLEVDHVTFQYQDEKKLFKELILNKMIAPEISTLPALTAQYEIVYGHAFGASYTDFVPDEDGVVRIPLSHLKRK